MNLAQLSIKRPTFITAIVTLMLVMGFAALKKMPVDLFPDVTFPVIFIGIPYPGAAPNDIERQVMEPVEEALGGIAGLRNMTSNSLESVGLLILEFRLGSDVKDLEQQVRNRLGNIRNKLPKDTKEPIIRRFDPADQPVISLAVSSSLSDGELFDLAENTIKPQIERLNDIGQVRVIGGRKKEVQVLVDLKQLQDRRLSMLQVSNRVRETSQDVPVGKITGTMSEDIFRAIGGFNSLEDLKKVTVNFLGSDRPVLLSDIARVEMGLEDQTQIGRLNGKSALFLEVFKQSGSNTVAVSDNVKASLDKVNALLQERKIDAKIQTIRDGSKPIRMNIADVYESIILGVILTIIVVYFFLGSLRSTFITGMALPNSLLGGFIIMYVMGFSINLMTLLALSLAVGLLIDDAIVVRENIFRYLENGMKPIDAAIKGTQEVSQAVIATTLVVIAVFGPIAFLQGMVGQFFKQFGLSVVFMMLISLFDAFTVAPMLSAYMTVQHSKDKKKGFWANLVAKFDQFQTWLEDKYEETIKYTLKHKIGVIVGSVVIFIFSIVIMILYVPKTFIPANDNGEFAVTLEMPPGTSLTHMSEFTKKIEDHLSQDPMISLISTTVGSRDNEANKASLYVQLVPSKQRKLNTTEAKEKVRVELNQFRSEAFISVSDIDISGGGQKPFNLTLSGDDLDQLTKYASELKVKMEGIPDLVDVDTNFRTGKPEFHIVFDREKSEALGISTVTAGAELRARTEGVEAAVFREKNLEYNVKLRLSEDTRDISKHFEETLVPNANFNMIPLTRVARPESTVGYSQINRQNKNRFILITANLSKKGSLGNATTMIENILKKDLPPPKGVDYRYIGQAEDFKDLINNMLLAIGLAILFIYLVLASLYESFVTPFSILVALPMAISGAMLLLFVTGKSIDIFSLIGIVMLLGVVAKNSILLVDYANQLLGEGLSRDAALIKAGRVRLRPILMTSFALIAGTLPIAIGLSELGSFRQSMGLAIVGGVFSSTLLTLVVVPAVFGYVDDFRLWSRRLFGLQ